MKIFTRNTFRSVANPSRVIKVTKIERDAFGNSRYDVCKVVDVNDFTGKKIPGTERTVYADSIRRRYYLV